MAAEVSLYQRSRAAVGAHAIASREIALAIDARDASQFEFWQRIACACIAEHEECDAAIRAGVEAYLGFSGLQTGNSDLHQLEA